MACQHEAEDEIQSDDSPRNQARTGMEESDKKVLVWRLKKGSINQRIGFRLGSGWIHHSSHLEVELWTLGIGASDTRVEESGSRWY
jgi:hypothetical protein